MLLLSWVAAFFLNITGLAIENNKSGLPLIYF